MKLSFLKSLFTAVYPLFCVLVFSFALSDLLIYSFSYSHLGIIVSSGAAMLYFILLYVINRTSTDKYVRQYSIPLLIGTGVGLVSLFLEEIEFFHLTLLIGVVIGWGLYLFWSSAFFDREENEVLQVGKKLPELVLKNSHDDTVSSSLFSGKYTVYIFYRGNWCPFCTAQIEEVVREQEELNKRGVNTVFISPQPHKYTERIGRKRIGDFFFLIDTNNAVAKKLNIFSPYGLPTSFQVFGFDSDTVLPTVIITNRSDEIIYLDMTENYRIRPEPSEFLKVIDEYNLATN